MFVCNFVISLTGIYLTRELLQLNIVLMAPCQRLHVQKADLGSDILTQRLVRWTSPEASSTSLTHAQRGFGALK